MTEFTKLKITFALALLGTLFCAPPVARPVRGLATLLTSATT